MRGYVVIMILAGLLLLTACKQGANPLSPLFGEPDHAGEFLDNDDVLRIAGGLTSAPDQTPLQWENPATGYQYSMLISKTEPGAGGSRRDFTVLAIRPDREAELLTLTGSSIGRGKWAITALKPGVIVGHAARMELAPSAPPKGELAAREDFQGFPIASEE